MAADCSGRGNEERISRTAKMLLGMWQTAIHRSPRSARGGDGAHDANMNKDWSKEQSDIILKSGNSIYNKYLRIIKII